MSAYEAGTIMTVSIGNGADKNNRTIPVLIYNKKVKRPFASTAKIVTLVYLLSYVCSKLK